MGFCSSSVLLNIVQLKEIRLSLLFTLSKYIYKYTIAIHNNLFYNEITEKMF